MPQQETPSPLRDVIERIESFGGADEPAKAVSNVVSDTLGPGALKDALSGTALGHALHPLLTDVVIGSFLSATALDLIGGEESQTGSERLTAIGIAAYLPTAMTGASDWADGAVGNDAVRRVGVFHAVSNSVALGFYGASLRAKRRGSRGKGVAYGVAGAGVLGFAGYLGAHISYALGVGVDQTVFDAGPDEWTSAGDVANLADGQLTQRIVEDTPVVLLRRGETTLALHDRCSHRGCSLAERGEVSGDVVECNCHGSRFSLVDGSLLRGPATQPQPAFETREREGKLEIKLQT